MSRSVPGRIGRDRVAARRTVHDAQGAFAYGARARPFPRRMGPAAERSLRELRRTDRLDRCDAALIAAYRDAAALADAEMTAVNRSTWAAVRALRLVVDVHARLVGDTDSVFADDVDDFYRALRTASTGDAPPA